jgi:hypothetical protein
VDSASSQLLRHERAPRGTRAGKATVLTEEISPQDAAAILQSSRPSVIRLIAKGHLHPRKVLSRNKLSRAEVVNYRIEQSRQQRPALSNRVTLAENYDLRQGRRPCLRRPPLLKSASCFQAGARIGLCGRGRYT